jgi:hypothetical protein
MSTFATCADIVNSALSKAGELTDGTSEFQTIAYGYLNEWHRGILAGSTELDIDCGDPWIWARKTSPGIVVLEPKVELTGGVVLGSTALTLSAIYATSLAGWHVKLGSDVEMYRVATHVAGSAAVVLDGAYIKTTGTYTATFLKLEYTLAADILRLCAPMRSFTQSTTQDASFYSVEGIDVNSFDRDYPLAVVKEGAPTRFCEVYESTLGVVRIRFNKYPSIRSRLEYDYIENPADLTSTSVPVIPIEHRRVLAYAVAYQLLHDKNDDRKDEYRELTAAALKALVMANRRTKSSTGQSQYGRVIPRREQMVYYNRNYRV